MKKIVENLNNIMLKKQRKEIDEMQSKITKVIHEQNSTHEDIQLFK